MCARAYEPNCTFLKIFCLDPFIHVESDIDIGKKKTTTLRKHMIHIFKKAIDSLIEM